MGRGGFEEQLRGIKVIAVNKRITIVKIRK
jgi:hypothetical protein